MSKLVKSLETAELKRRLDGVDDLVVLDVVGLNSSQTAELRAELRKKGYSLAVVKNSLAVRVLEENGIKGMAPVFEGSSAILTGGPGIVELAKEIQGWAKKLEKLGIKGGCIGRQPLDPAGVEAVSKMPSREQLIGKVLQLILSPGARLASQLIGPGGAVASQIKEYSENGKGEPTASA